MHAVRECECVRYVSVSRGAMQWVGGEQRRTSDVCAQFGDAYGCCGIGLWAVRGTAGAAACGLPCGEASATAWGPVVIVAGGPGAPMRCRGGPGMWRAGIGKLPPPVERPPLEGDCESACERYGDPWKRGPGMEPEGFWPAGGSGRQV